MTKVRSVDKSFCASTASLVVLRELALDNLLVLLQDGSHFFLSRIVDESAGSHWLGLGEPLLAAEEGMRQGRLIDSQTHSLVLLETEEGKQDASN